MHEKEIVANAYKMIKVLKSLITLHRGFVSMLFLQFYPSVLIANTPIKNIIKKSYI